MNRTARFVSIATALITAFLLLLLSLRPGRAAAGNLPTHADAILPGRLIVKFKHRPPILGKSAPIAALPLSDKLRRMLQAAGAISARPAFPARMIQDAVWRERLSRIVEIEFDPAVPVRPLVAALQKDDRIEYAEPIYVRRLTFAPNDPGLTLQNYLPIIRAQQAWDLTHGDSTVVIAIVDTGVDWQHPDLAPNLWRNPGEIPGNGLDDDGNGYIDDVHGWDFAQNDNDPKNYASTAAAAHGTHVAGLAAAVGNNGLGIAGLAFGCRLMILKAALDTPPAPAVDGIIYGFRAIAYAIENGADVINLSWGGPGSSQVEQEIIRYAVSRGVVVVAAAGNNQSEQPFYPAAYEHVLAVAATNLNDERASFSNFGHWVDLTAPGIGLYSTWPGDDYRFMSGTSMAAPLVAAAAALVKSQHADWSAAAVAQQLRQTADPIGDKNPDQYYKLGRGRLNVYRALTETPPGIRILSPELSDQSGGDGDGIFEPGETLELRWRVTNDLAPVSGFRVRLIPLDAHLDILTGDASLGALAPGDTLEGPAFQFRIKETTPASYQTHLILQIEAGPHRDFFSVPLVVKPYYRNIVAGRVATTITSFGAIGFLDYAGSGGTVGLGFQYPRGKPSALFHGSLILAAAPDSVSDVAYGNDIHDRYDFQSTADGEIQIGKSDWADIVAEAVFTDAAADHPLGVLVFESVYAWQSEPNDRFVILEYTVENISGQDLRGLTIGQYLDWDIGEAVSNQVGFIESETLGFMFADSGGYYGLAGLLADAPVRHSAINNPQYVWPPANFTDAIKFRFASGQLAIQRSDRADDWSHMLTYGPFDLAPGASVRVAFAVVAGADLAELRQNARLARMAYRPSVISGALRSTLPRQFAFLPPAPNPLSLQKSAAVVLRFSLPQPQAVSLQLYNILGQRIAALPPRRFHAGAHRLSWRIGAAGRRLEPGVYFLRLQAGPFSRTRKVLILP